MTNTLTFRSLVAFFLLLLGMQQVSAQSGTLLCTETFSDQTTSLTNWVSGGTNGGTLSWDWTNVLDAGNYQPGMFGAPSAADGYMWFDSDGNGDFPHDITLTSTVACDASGADDVHLRFYTLFRIFNVTGSATVEVSVDNGATWVSHEIPEFQGLAANQRYEGWVDLDLPEADNQSSVLIRFRWAGQYEYWWKVDDIALYDFELLPVDVTFRVNASQITVDPAGMQLAGSFNGWSDLQMTDAGGGVWYATVSLNPGETVQYKFKNGPGGWESVTAACGVDDGFGGFNREYTVPADASTDITLPVVCFGECENCEVPCNLNPNAIICDDFETYTLGILSPQATWWKPWAGSETDPIVNADVTDAEASNGTKAMVIQYEIQGTNQGNDQILDLGNKTTGRYELKWQMYVPSEHAGYYNIQNSIPAGVQWNLDVFFDSTGVGRYDINPSTAQGVDGEFDFPFDQWFEVRHVIDLDNNIAKVWINDSYVDGWTYTGNLGGIDFYALTAWDLNYIDEVEYVQLPTLTFNADFCDAAVDLTGYFGGAPTTPVVTPLYSNDAATVSGTDPLPSCFEDAPAAAINNTVWFTFTGDGNKYDIETVECTAGANYIDDGDTQMAIYEGECGNLTEIACDEDFDLAGGDYRAVIQGFETQPGVEYSILIDGWSNAGVAATGAFCIQITQLANIDCSEGAVGDFALDNNGFVCSGVNVSEILTVDPSGFVIPTVGPSYGMAWAVTTVPVQPGQYPTELGTDYFGSTGLNTSVIEVGFTNAQLTPNIYYLTPVVVAGAVDTNLTNAAAFLHDIDLSGACVFVGESQQIVLLPDLDPLVVTQTVTDPTGGQNNGSILLDVQGGFPPLIGDPSLFNYSFQWTGPNGFTSTEQNITGLAAGTYTVTVSDPSNCIDPVVVSNITVAVNDPTSVTTLQLTPNPTAGAVLLNLGLAQASDVRIEVLNTLGQVLQTAQAGRVNTLQQSLDFSSYANGTYFVRVVIDGETAIRRVAVQK